MFLAFSGCASMKARTTQATVVESKDQLYQVVKSTNWLATVAIVGIGFSVFAFLNGSSKAVSALGACFVVLSITLMLAEFAWWVAALTLLGSICLVVYTVFVRKRAFTEVVNGCEKLKGELEGLGHKELFKDIMRSAQKTHTTEELVSIERGKLNDVSI